MGIGALWGLWATVAAAAPGPAVIHRVWGPLPAHVDPVAVHVIEHALVTGLDCETGAVHGWTGPESLHLVAHRSSSACLDQADAVLAGLTTAELEAARKETEAEVRGRQPTTADRVRAWVYGEEGPGRLLCCTAPDSLDAVLTARQDLLKMTSWRSDSQPPVRAEQPTVTAEWVPGLPGLSVWRVRGAPCPMLRDLRRQLPAGAQVWAGADDAWVWMPEELHPVLDSRSAQGEHRSPIQQAYDDLGAAAAWDRAALSDSDWAWLSLAATGLTDCSGPPDPYVATGGADLLAALAFSQQTHRPTMVLAPRPPGPSPRPLPDRTRVLYVPGRTLVSADGPAGFRAQHLGPDTVLDSPIDISPADLRFFLRHTHTPPPPRNVALVLEGHHRAVRVRCARQLVSVRCGSARMFIPETDEVWAVQDDAIDGVVIEWSAVSHLPVDAQRGSFGRWSPLERDLLALGVRDHRVTLRGYRIDGQLSVTAEQAPAVLRALTRHLDDPSGLPISADAPWEAVRPARPRSAPGARVVVVSARGGLAQDALREASLDITASTTHRLLALQSAARRR